MKDNKEFVIAVSLTFTLSALILWVAVSSLTTRLSKLEGNFTRQPNYVVVCYDQNGVIFGGPQSTAFIQNVQVNSNAVTFNFTSEQKGNFTCRVEDLSQRVWVQTK